MKDKLLRFLDEGSFVSGKQLAQHLGISRTAIWKHINNLRDLGYKIVSGKNKGYRLLARPDIPIREEVSRGLDTQIIGKEIYYYKKLNSTNIYAKELVTKGAKEGSVIIADIQTYGRGRRDSNWYSPQGGLWFSVILTPSISLNRAMMITMVASTAVAEAIKIITKLTPKIKWPNDILLRSKKVCGILTEIDTEIHKINFAIVGIGLNVNNTLTTDLQEQATSLLQELNTQVSRVQLLRVILKRFDIHYNKLVSGRYDSIRRNWLSFSNIIKQKVRIKDGTTSTIGIVSGIDEDGYLLVQTLGGTRRILSADITYI